MNLPPKRVKTGPVQDIVWRGDEVDLSRIPILKCWPLDGGPFVTLPLVISKDPETGERNMGMYRMQVMGKNTTGMHWQRHKTGTKHLEKAKRLGQRLEVAVAIGGDPALIYAATAPLPPIPARTSSRWRATCAGNATRSRGGSPSIWTCRPTPNSFWKATWTPPRTG